MDIVRENINKSIELEDAALIVLALNRFADHKRLGAAGRIRMRRGIVSRRFDRCGDVSDRFEAW